MRTLCVVVASPSFDCVPAPGQAQEPARIEVLITKFSVEGLDIAVRIGLPGSRCMTPIPSMMPAGFAPQPALDWLNAAWLGTSLNLTKTWPAPMPLGEPKLIPNLCQGRGQFPPELLGTDPAGCGSHGLAPESAASCSESKCSWSGLSATMHMCVSPPTGRC
jgi:hypothetical protein